MSLLSEKVAQLQAEKKSLEQGIADCTEKLALVNLQLPALVSALEKETAANSAPAAPAPVSKAP